MTRYVILILLSLVIVACVGSSSTELNATETVVEESAFPTTTVMTPTNAPKPSETSTLSPTSTPTETATPSVIPTRPFTPTPSLTPTPQTTTRSQDGMSMVFVPVGDFIMGSPPGEGGDEEFPQHKVTLDAYWIDRTEVTNAQYQLFVSATGHEAPTSCDWGDPTYNDIAYANHPVVCVSWKDAKAYCEWAGARLPTEAEWEKAARGTDNRTYPWGSSFDGSRTNYCDTNCEGSHKDTGVDDGYARTAPVGSFPLGISPFGALDMAGNVVEWVSDWYSVYYYARSPQLNPQGPMGSLYRALRGGSWYGTYTNERIVSRFWMTPDSRDAATGFRCVVPFTSSP
jgi:formylglycine-generating enzyme required for sulfatase activity